MAVPVITKQILTSSFLIMSVRTNPPIDLLPEHEEIDGVGDTSLMVM